MLRACGLVSYDIDESRVELEAPGVAAGRTGPQAPSELGSKDEHEAARGFGLGAATSANCERLN